MTKADSPAMDEARCQSQQSTSRISAGSISKQSKLTSTEPVAFVRVATICFAR